MIVDRIFILATALVFSLLPRVGARAQDIPGVEICTVEKTMERRTSCLQSNIDFLQRTITRLGADHQQKLDAANRQIEGLKITVASLQKMLEELQAVRRKELEDHKKAGTPPDKEAQPASDARPAKESPK